VLIVPPATAVFSRSVGASYTEDEMPVAFNKIASLVARDPALRGGRPIIAGTGVCVRTIVIESNRGLSPEEIAADRPPLSLPQIHAALAFYHANKKEIDADIAAEEQAYEEGVRSSGLPPCP
jgi:uncharacterized protein (DUF433 family)